MAATTFSSLASRVLLEVPRCSAPLAEQALLDTSVDFLDKSGIYVVDHASVNLVAGTGTYTLTSPVVDYEVARVQQMWWGNVVVKPDSADRLTQNWEDDSGSPAAYIQETTDSFRLVPMPDAGAVAAQATLTIRVVLRPTRAATGVESWIANGWLDALVSGAKARLLAMPETPWANPQFATHYAGLYQAQLCRAQAAGQRSLTRTALSVAMRPAA